MLKSYLKSTLRSLWREGGYTALNVAGLAVALAVCVLMGLYIRFQTSFDQFHEASERLVRIVDGESVRTAHALGPALVTELPEVQTTSRIQQDPKGTRVLRGDRADYEDGVVHADSTFFELFGFDLTRGDPLGALDRPFTVVLTERLASKYFGDVDPLGKSIQIGPPGEARSYEVTGIIEDPPPNTHLSFSALISYSTLGTEAVGEDVTSWASGGMTYVRLAPGTDREVLAERIGQVARRHTEETSQIGPYRLQPVASIHLTVPLEGEHRSTADSAHLYLFGSLALLLLILAGVNYVNLATARATRRASEIGIRKAVGSSRGQIAGQFLLEAVVTGLIAGLIGGGLAHVGLPHMESLTGTPLTDAPTTSTFSILAGTVGGGLLAGILAGAYPALILSGLQPNLVLRSRSSLLPSGEGVRKALIGLQFAISVGFIAATFVIWGQLDFMQSTDLGVEAEQVIVVSTRGHLGDNYDVFKKKLEQRSDITVVSASVTPFPAPRSLNVNTVRPEGMSEQEYERREKEGSLENQPLNVAAGFTKAMGIEMAQGRRLGDPFGSQDSLQAVINQTAAQQFGWEKPVGKTVYWLERPVRVVGVSEDFHYQPFERHIRPLTLIQMPGGLMRDVFVRFKGSNSADVLEAVRSAWAQFGDGTPLDYSFLDQRYAEIYRSEQRLASVASTCSIIALFLAGLGLFGLASYTVTQRRKEISIRKVMGASLERLVATVSGEFMRLAAWGAVLAIPLTALLMRRWLTNFAYRIDLGLWSFLGAGLLTLIVALISVAYQSLTAALLNPAEALRQE